MTVQHSRHVVVSAMMLVCRLSLRGLPAVVLLLWAPACRVYDSSLLESGTRSAAAGGANGGSTLTASSDAGGTTSSSDAGGGTTSSSDGDGGTSSGGLVTSTSNTTGPGSSSDTTGAGGSGGTGSGGVGGSAATGGGGGNDSPTATSTTGAGCELDDCCPDSPDKTDPGQCGCDLPDTDTDGDGAADCIDECPDDADKSAPGECGCGMPDEDTLLEAGCVGLEAGIVHRYSFDAAGSEAVDSESGADAELVGTTLDGSGQLVLSSETTEQYATLPAGVLSSLTSASIEVWFTWDGGPMWTRLFDFGSTVEGVPGEPGTGQTSVVFSPNGSEDPGYPYAGFSSSDPETDVSCAINSSLTTGVEYHVVLALDSSLDTFTLYIDGALACASAMSADLSQLDDVNCWIGRSQFSTDTGFSGSIEEFRIYDVALTTQQVALSFASGPEPDFL